MPWLRSLCYVHPMRALGARIFGIEAKRVPSKGVWTMSPPSFAMLYRPSTSRAAVRYRRQHPPTYGVRTHSPCVVSVCDTHTAMPWSRSFRDVYPTCMLGARVVCVEAGHVPSEGAWMTGPPPFATLDRPSTSCAAGRHCRWYTSTSGEHIHSPREAPTSCAAGRCATLCPSGYHLLLRHRRDAKTRRIDFRRTGPRYPVAANEPQHVVPRHPADVDTTYRRPASEVTQTWTSNRPARMGVEKPCCALALA